MANGKDPKKVTEKWQRRTAGAVNDMVEGVKAVTENPMQQAIAKEQKLVQNWNASITEGKWRRGMGKITIDDWKNSMTTLAAQRVPAGVQAAGGKFEAFMAELLPFQENIKREIEAMPDVTLQDGINRAVAWMTKSAQFKRRGQ